MPLLTKQAAPTRVAAKALPNRSPTASAWSRVQAFADMPEKGLKLAVYGRGKTGKTRLACSFPKPLLLVGTEDGTISVRRIEGGSFCPITSSSEFQELVDGCGAQGVRTIVLDTAGGFQDILLKEILGLQEVPFNRSWGMAQQADWQVCTAQTKEKLRSLLDLAQTGVNAVVIAHERNFSDESKSDVIIPSVGAALTPQASNWLSTACDYVCHCFIANEVVTKQVKTAAGVSRQEMATGKLCYRLRIGADPVYMTGFRHEDLTKELPNSIPIPLSCSPYEEIMKVIKS